MGNTRLVLNRATGWSIGFAIAISSLFGGPLLARTVRADTVLAQTPNADRGQNLFQTYCAACHSLNPPPLKAPPARGLVMQYSLHYPTQDAFADAVTAFVRGDKRDHALLKEAEARFGAMPALPLPENDLQTIARWMWEYFQSSKPALDESSLTSIQAQGDEVASALALGLRKVLMQKIQAEGPAEAVDFCSLQALPLTREISAEKNLQVRRTTLRPRNEANAPDALDKQVLARWSDAASLADIKPVVEINQRAHEVRFYKPIFIEAACLACHGSSIDPATREAISRKYNNDQAINYKVGDVRGAVVVSFPRRKTPYPSSSEPAATASPHQEVR